jgi:predicted dehydrogenase
MKDIRIGMIGYGFMGRAHSNAFRKAGNFFDLPCNVVLQCIRRRSEAMVRENHGWKA